MEIKNDHAYITQYCRSNGHPHSFPMYCGRRSCGFCRENKYLRLLNIYLPRIRKIKSYRLKQITLTFRNEARLTRASVAKGLKRFARLRNTPFWKNSVRGALAVFEVKHVSDEKGFNFHIHVLADSSYLSQKELSRLWLGITGDSFIVDIRKEENNARAVFHILKYLSKSPVLSGADSDALKCEYDNAFYRVRSVISYGSLYDDDGADSSVASYRFACPVCGCQEWLSEFEFERLRKNSQKVVPELVSIRPG